MRWYAHCARLFFARMTFFWRTKILEVLFWYVLSHASIPYDKYGWISEVYNVLRSSGRKRFSLCQVTVFTNIIVLYYFFCKKYEFTEIIIFYTKFILCSLFCIKVVYWFTVQYCITPCCFKLTGHFLSHAIYFNQTKLLALPAKNLWLTQVAKLI